MFLRKLALIAVLFAVEANAQEKRTQLWDSYYDGYTAQPGLSVYPGSGFYSRDYPSGRMWYHYGYRPPTHGHRPIPRQFGGPIYSGHTYGLTPQPWMFYYNGMQNTPYNINSPIWW